jgi:hypothetical protein
VTLRVTEVQSLDRITANAIREVDFWVRLGTALSVSGLMLSLTGIYAVMSFTVSRRTREIGIRVALGSNGARVVLAILRTPLIQVVAGVIAGTMLTLALSSGFTFAVKPSWAGALAGYAVVMLGVCLLASLRPSAGRSAWIQSQRCARNRGRRRNLAARPGPKHQGQRGRLRRHECAPNRVMSPPAEKVPVALLIKPLMVATEPYGLGRLLKSSASNAPL